MTMLSVHCDIVSAEENLFSGLVQMVVAAGEMGDLGIIRGHAPLLTALTVSYTHLTLPTNREV